jgi:predicted GNAT family acetyltransferase
MEVINPKDASSFLQICQKALEENEVNSNLILGISNTLSKNSSAYGTDEPFYSIAINNNEISLIGLMTPPKNLLLYEHKNLNTDVIELFANNLFSQHKRIPGITGELMVTKSFLEKWNGISPCSYKIGKNMRKYKLTQVGRYNKPDGIFRCVEMEDIVKITDLLNPTSNSIYKKIGYKPICDNVSYVFDYEV